MEIPASRDTSCMSRNSRWLAILLLLLAIPCQAGELPWESFSNRIDAAAFSPLLFLAAYLLAQQLFLSSTAFNIIGGALFGPWLGTLLNLTGAMGGATLSFLVSRHLLAQRITPHLPDALARLLDEVAQEGWRGVAFVRLMPGLPYALLNYTLGLSKLTLRQFLPPTLLCILPRIALYTYLGHSGRAALEGKAEMVWHIIVVLGLLVALTWLPHLWSRMHAR